MTEHPLIPFLKAALAELEREGVVPAHTEVPITLEWPENPKHGDMASTIALRLAKAAKKNPLELAKEIAARIQKNPEASKLCEAVTAVPPGFLNFTLSARYLQQCVADILEANETYGNSAIGKGKKVLIEFISANPTGPLTLANGRGGFVGDVLARVSERAGYTADREYYINDIGNQIVSLGRSVLAARGVIPDSEEMYHGDYLTQYSEGIDAQQYKDQPEALGELVAKKILEHEIQPVVADMRIPFKQWFSEKSLHTSGEYDKTLAWLKDKKLSYEQDGATWYRTTPFGDDKDRVLIKKDGEHTYFASDIAYHKNKYDRGYTHLINIWGADHHGYVGRMLAACGALGHKDDITIIIMQLVKLVQGGKEFRMSKRRGVYVTLKWLLSEVGVDVARFFFLMRDFNSHLNFDLDLAKEKSEKNPVFYVQYAHARISSILRKAPQEMLEGEDHLALLVHESEHALIRKLTELPELIETIATTHETHLLPFYAIELARAFHAFYRDCQVISEHEDMTRARLALVRAAHIVLKNTLDTLGVSAPETM